MEGKWALTYRDGGGVSGDCVGVSPAEGPATVEILRSGAELRSTLGGLAARGTVYDTSDFTLSATEVFEDGGSRSLGLKGYFVPAGGKPDGGTPARLEGAFTSRADRGALSCVNDQRFSGLR
jgi:hypothetical protein